MTTATVRAALARCHDCAFTVSLPAVGAALCPRCGAAVHRRKVDSISRTWALAIAAAVLYVPANVFPVMTVVSLGKAQSDTILSGVIYLLLGRVAGGVCGMRSST